MGGKGGKGSQQGKGGKDLTEGEKDLGKKAQQGTGGKDLRKEKGEALRGGKGLRGERISAEGGKGEDLGTKAFGGKGEK